MSDDRRRYARFYYEQFLTEYPEIYDSDRLFAAWMRLLVGAEKAWPNDPELPRRVARPTLATLIEKGVVTLSGFHYTLRGYRAERERRANVGKAGADARWHANGHANADANALRSTRTSTRKREAEQGARAITARATYGLVEP